jgi:transcriptional regulator with XRE-family HTH domain
VLRIELERRKRNLTQKGLGIATKIPAADICRIERGVLKPYPGHLKRLSAFFDVPENELMREV